MAAGAAALSRLEKGSPAIKSSKEVYNECTSTSQTAEMSGVRELMFIPLSAVHVLNFVF